MKFNQNAVRAQRKEGLILTGETRALSQGMGHVTQTWTGEEGKHSAEADAWCPGGANESDVMACCSLSSIPFCAFVEVGWFLDIGLRTGYKARWQRNFRVQQAGLRSVVSLSLRFLIQRMRII